MLHRDPLRILKLELANRDHDARLAALTDHGPGFRIVEDEVLPDALVIYQLGGHLPGRVERVEEEEVGFLDRDLARVGLDEFEIDALIRGDLIKLPQTRRHDRVVAGELLRLGRKPRAGRNAGSYSKLGDGFDALSVLAQHRHESGDVGIVRAGP